jgi:hypothetical protein
MPSFLKGPLDSLRFFHADKNVHLATFLGLDASRHALQSHFFAI